RAGRLVNQIFWHAQQAWLRIDHQHARTVAQLLDDLSLAVRSAVPRPTQADVEAAVVRHREWWVGGFGHVEHHHESLIKVNEDIIWILQHQYDDIAKARAEAFWHIFPFDFHTSLREVVVRHLLEDEIPLLDLGECVDQGIRPAVAEWLYDPDIQ